MPAPDARSRSFRARALACAGLAAVTAASASEMKVSVVRAGPQLDVRASVHAPAPAHDCYAVLADFDRLAEFVPRLRSSRVVSDPGEPILLRQVGEASVGPFRRTVDVILLVREHPPARLEFVRVAGNLREMAGEWRVVADGPGCRIDYQARIEPAFWVPPLLGARLMQGQVEEQLRALAAEIERRAHEGAEAGE